MDMKADAIRREWKLIFHGPKIIKIKNILREGIVKRMRSVSDKFFLYGNT